MLLKTIFSTVLLTFSGICIADTYPTRPVTVITTGAAGGAVDGAARMIAEEMGKRMGQPFVVENKPGAGGMLAVQAAMRAKPDGYTLLVAQSSALLNTPLLHAKPPYDARRDLAFLTRISSAGLVFVVNNNIPVRNMKEFLEWAARNKGKVNYGSYALGGFGHLAGAYLSKSKNLDMNHIPYKGEAPMIQDIIGGRLSWGLIHPRTAGPLLESGRVRAIAQFNEQRAKNLPNVPTMVEVGLIEPMYKQIGWTGLLAPANTPAPVLEKLEKEARASLQTATLQSFFESTGAEIGGNSSADFRREFEASVPVIQHMIKVSGAMAE